MKKTYRHINHTADFGLEILGTDAIDLFVQAASALIDLIVDPGAVKGQNKRMIEVTGEDWPDLMVNWLRELLYLFNGEDQIVCHIAIQTLDPGHLQAQVTTDDFCTEVHQVRNEIKAVTYHQIEVGPDQDGWRAKVIFDI